MGLFGNNSTVTTTFKGKDDLSPVVRGMRNTMEGFKRDAKTGFGLAAGFSVFQAGKQVIGEVAGFLMDAAEAAMEDEKSVAKLNTTLRNSVPGWERYQGAIDAATEKGLELAFADDEVRESLSRLIPYTKDVNEAIRLNGLAMDLARARNMNLVDAAALLGKAYGGQVTALRRAGIAIGNTKDATQALARVQEQVSGQAEAYAGTAEGSYKTLQLTIDELVESIGYELLPYIKDFATYVRQDVIPQIDGWTDSIHKLIDAAAIATAMVPEFGSSLGDTSRVVSLRLKHLERNAFLLTDAWTGLGDAAVAAGSDMSPDNPAGPAAAVRGTTRRMLRSMNAVTEPWKQDWKNLAEWAKDPFTPSKFEKWLGERAERATRNAQRAAERGKPGVARRWRAIAAAMKNPVTRALLDIGVGVDQAIIDIRTVQLAGQNLAGVMSGLFNVFGNDHDGPWTNSEFGDRTKKGGGRRRHRKAIGGMTSGYDVVGEYGPEVIRSGSAKAHVTPSHAGGGDIVLQIDGYTLMRWIDNRMGRQMAFSGLGD